MPILANLNFPETEGVNRKATARFRRAESVESKMAVIWTDELDERSEYCAGPHKWGEWKIVEYTGDWFHPYVVRRWCKICPARETEER
jgi:hypothetical protein